MCAKQLGREWIGIDNEEEYLRWGVNRLKNVQKKSIAEWIQFDKAIVSRRETIR